MPVKIYSVKKGSVFYRAGVREGDSLLSVNGEEISDVFDYQFYCDNQRLCFRIARFHGGIINLVVNNTHGGRQHELGFETYLMDRHQRCKNKCMFCFVDQMPAGLRESLYFKDDDSRLSFLFGNYITLTGLSEREAARIIKMRISPVNISVHTMNPDLRVKMMGNPGAGESLKLLERFADADITMNTQLVLCPGVNDGDELRYSLERLSMLYPAVASIAVIPVGLTKYRAGLVPIKPYTKEVSRGVIGIVDEFNAHFMYYHGRRLAYAADEFYLNALLPMPGADYYDEFPQLDNGVGLCALFRSEFLEALNRLPGNTVVRKRKIALVTGKAAYGLICELVGIFKDKFAYHDIEVFCVENNFFGSTVSVAGLLTAKDIIEQCRGKISGGELLMPQVMLKSDDEMIFLDGVSVDELAGELGVKAVIVPNDGAMFLDKLLGK